MAKAPDRKSILLPPAHLFAITYDYIVNNDGDIKHQVSNQKKKLHCEWVGEGGGLMVDCTKYYHGEDCLSCIRNVQFEIYR